MVGLELRPSDSIKRLKAEEGLERSLVGEAPEVQAWGGQHSHKNLGEVACTHTPSAETMQRKVILGDWLVSLGE